MATPERSSGENADVQDSLRVSVIIPNYNYGDFVAQAIESALGLDWPRVEVIVVDDGSTDHSRREIDRYRDRVEIVFQANAGQRAACNAGLARSHGDVVIFLDSDDLLEPSLIRELAAVWRPGVSKVQFQMKLVDRDGRPSGTVLPQYHVVPTASQVRRWATEAGAYPTPPGSGNAYARSFLERLFPLPEGDGFSDTYCLSVAPFFGDVVTVPKPLVCYRIHAHNNGAMDAMDHVRFSRELRRAIARREYAARTVSVTGVSLPVSNLRRSLSCAPYRIASLRLTPELHPWEDDSPWKAWRDLARAAVTPQGVNMPGRVALFAWGTGVLLAPSQLAEDFILWRFAPAQRPRALRSLLTALGITKRYRTRAAAG